MFRNPRLLLLAFALAAVAVLLALLASTIGRPPVRPPLPNPNGNDDFIKASEALLGNVDDFPTLDQDSFAALVSTNAEPLRLLRLGLTRQCVMPTDSALTNNYNLLPGLRRLAQLLAAEGRLREMENRPAEAAQSYVDALRYGNEMSRGGFLINRLLGITCEAIGYAQQFSLWPRQCPPGEGTRPTPSTKPCCCRPGALTRHPFAAHNENC